MAISKRTRFEVFQRNHFTCQYCGQRAPDVVLQVDHIQPRAAGGSDDVGNLITSCVDCNQGKSAISLDNQEWGRHQIRIASIIAAVEAGDLPPAFAKSPRHVLAWAQVGRLIDDCHPDSPYRKSDDEL